MNQSDCLISGTRFIKLVTCVGMHLWNWDSCSWYYNYYYYYYYQYFDYLVILVVVSLVVSLHSVAVLEADLSVLLLLFQRHQRLRDVQTLEIGLQVSLSLPLSLPIRAEIPFQIPLQICVNLALQESIEVSAAEASIQVGVVMLLSLSNYL